MRPWPGERAPASSSESKGPQWGGAEAAPAFSPLVLFPPPPPQCSYPT